MPNLSTPIAELRSRYGVVVVGSGYGGAIAAYRLATAANDLRAAGRPSFSVCLLERGLEIRPGDYPSTFANGVRGTQVDTRLGRVGKPTSLFDFHINREVSVLVGCGLGGTSLINANVMLQPAALGAEWPEDLRRTGLAREFAMAADALGAAPMPPDVTLNKVTKLFDAARDAAEAMRPPIAVSFQTHVNAFGVQQQRCVLCGNCVSGCNYSAKNTLIMNYLPGAAAAGAEIYCGVAVQTVEPGRESTWLVRARLLDWPSRLYGSPEVAIRADVVFLASGALGSTQILLRSHSRRGLSVSPALGSHFSGNGDVIGFGYNVRDHVDGMGYGKYLPPETNVGPTIAGMLDERKANIPLVIQEGAIPGALGGVLRLLAPFIARLSFVSIRQAGSISAKPFLRELDSLLRGVRHGALARTETFLAMGVDDGRGTMKLVGDRLRIFWHDAGRQKVFRQIFRRLGDLTRAMKGRYVANPLWARAFGRRLLTVHPLGGCRMAGNARDGVVNAWGQVYVNPQKAGTPTDVHRGLYVCDGSIVPAPLGVNPALTISALAERIAGKAAATAIIQPETRMAAGKRIDTTVAAIRYAERLRGTMVLNGDTTRIEMFLHMSAENMEELVDSSTHEVQIVGVAHTPDLDEELRLFAIMEGTLRVLVDDPRTVETKLLVYRLKLVSASGQSLWLQGHKTINYESCKRSTWRATTQVPFVLYDRPPGAVDSAQPYAGADHVDMWERTADPEQFFADWVAQGIVGAGRAKNSVADALRLLASMQVLYERRASRRLRLRLRFLSQFASAVIQARVWGVRRTDPINPFAPRVRANRVLAANAGTPIKDTAPRPRFIVTPFTKDAAAREPGKPILLVPAFSMSSCSFSALTPSPNITEFLCGNGYQVWLLDYRPSNRLEESITQFTVDDLAQFDIPNAIRALYAQVQQPIRIIGHCVGSLSVLMGLLRGYIDVRMVHSVVLSQAFAFIDQPFINRLKAWLHLAEVLRFFGYRPVMTPEFDIRSSVPTRLLDRALYFYPSRERCRNGVCRRLLLMFGEAHRHAQLDKMTHDMVYDLYDHANLTTLQHLQKMVVRGRIVDARGTNAYVRAENARRLTVPITLLQGAKNNLFRPSGALATYAWLLANGGFGSPAANRKMFRLVELEGYGHFDVWAGRNSWRDVFPKVLGALQEMEDLQALRT